MGIGAGRSDRQAEAEKTVRWVGGLALYASQGSVVPKRGRSWRLSLNRTGYKLGLYRAGGDLVDAQPIYRKHDPNCCPTGGFDHTRWHWNGKRFVAARRWHNKDYGPQAP